MLFNHNRKKVDLAWKIFSIIMIAGMLLFTLLPLFNR